MEFSLYTSSDVGKASNIFYPKKVVVTDAESMKAAVSFDHVGARYKENKRSNDTFMESDCLMLDFDNTHSEKEEEWVTPFDVTMEFPGVSFIAVFSRNHMKEKNGAVARPKFHAYFPVSKFVDVKTYFKFKRKCYQAYPFFDSNALDGARFFFGMEVLQMEVYEGDRTVAEILEEDGFEKWEASLEQITEGSRNTTMSHAAGKLIKRYGDTQTAYELFLKTATKCNPPLPDEELEKIWNSSKRFGSKVSKQDGYIPPEQYNSGCIETGRFFGYRTDNRSGSRVYRETPLFSIRRLHGLQRKLLGRVQAEVSENLPGADGQTAYRSGSRTEKGYGCDGKKRCHDIDCNSGTKESS